MKKTGWKYYLMQAVCWLLVFQMVNISIDPPDITSRLFFSHAQKPEKKINQIESIYELVSENLLDTEIQESDEPDKVEKTVTPLILFCSKPAFQSFEISLPVLQHQSCYTSSFSLLYSDPASPPPKVA